MTERLFVTVLNMSLTGSLVILAVLILRVFLRKAPRIFSYCLWAVVLIRLLCPVSFTAVFSPLNALHAPLTEHGSVEYISEDILQYQTSDVQNFLPQENTITDVSIQGSAAAPKASDSPELLLKPASLLWLTGILCMALYSVITLARLLKKLKPASRERNNIYISKAISTPFVIGLIRPRIYLPSTLGREEKRYILLHEQIHLKRGDHIVKILSFIALCLHWFNPLVWLAFFLSGKDMEMSCDEAVIRRIGSGVKKDYATSLLCLSTGKRIINGVPLAFGEGDTGSRIRNVLRYKKPAAFLPVIAAAACAVAAVILLANPADSAEPEELLTEYGVIMEVETDGAVRQMFISPWSGAREIPEAHTIDTYFEPGDTRDPHQLLPGDLVAITFAAREDIEAQEDDPARYSGPAESITILWEGLSLINLGPEPPSLLDRPYLLTFPCGAVPEVATAEPGDILSLYWEENEEEAYQLQLPESSQSRLITSTPILAVTENAAGGQMLTVGLTQTAAFQMLAHFGFHLRFALNTGEVTDNDKDRESQAVEAARAYLDSQAQQGQAARMPYTEETAASPNTYHVNIRSIARSAGVIDTYVAEDDFPYNGEELAFAENCVFKVNYSMDTLDYREVSFDDFADLIESADHTLNKPCILIFQDDLVAEVRLQSAWFHYGISFSASVPSATFYEFLIEEEGEDAFDTYYSLVDAENMDISDCGGTETIEVYTGNIGDGDSGIVLFKSADGGLLYAQDAHQARAGWNNIYLGERDGVPFIMNVHVEDRWDFGGYDYWVYRLDEQGGVRQIAGSAFDFWLGDDSILEYDDDLFREWVDGMTGWLADCHLILSSQEGEIRTEKVSEADVYNYDTLNLKDRDVAGF